MAVRLKDIARDLNLSVVTVSKVLRDASDISSATKERVLNRMRELNYQPNLAARSLATGRTSSIGFVVPSLLHPFFAEVAKGIVDVIRPKGYGLLISSSDEDEELERQEIEQLLARRVDGLIIASSQSSPAFFRSLEDVPSALVFIDRRFPGFAGNFVGVDDEQVGFIATAHLAERGYRKIAHIRGADVSTAAGRVKGYYAALERYGLEPRPDFVVRSRTADSDAEIGGRDAMRHLLSLNPSPDAVFCYNDPIAVGALQAIDEAGLRAPHGVAVIGCGNARWTQLLRVPLTSVDQGATEIGARAARMALKLIESKSAPRRRTVILPATVLPRDSTAPRRATGV